MNKRTTTAATVLVAATALAGASVLPGGSATADPTTHTQRLLLHETASHNLGKANFVGTDRVRSRATHKVVGYDTFSGRFDRQSETLRIHAAFAFKGGLLIARAHSVGEDRFRGTITSGTGAFAGATGTLRGRDLGHGNTALTLTYTL